MPVEGGSARECARHLPHPSATGLTPSTVAESLDRNWRYYLLISPQERFVIDVLPFAGERSGCSTSYGNVSRELGDFGMGDNFSFVMTHLDEEALHEEGSAEVVDHYT